MRQNEDTREPLDALKAERSLTIEFLSAPLPARHQRRMAILGLFQISSRAFDTAQSVFRETADQLIFAIEKLEISANVRPWSASKGASASTPFPGIREPSRHSPR
jgi:hypothetical protein